MKALVTLDKYLRYRFAASEVEGRGEILDVGGGLGDFLASHGLPGMVADLEADHALFTERHQRKAPFVTYDGEHLPFEDRHFPVVVSLDTLEHVPPAKRTDFLRELQRVCDSRLVLTFPTKKQHFFRTYLAVGTLYRRVGISSVLEKSLLEHRQNGLPDADEVIRQLKEAGWKVDAKRLFGPDAAIIVILQHIFPILALRRMTAAFAKMLAARNRGPFSYSFITATRKAG